MGCNSSKKDQKTEAKNNEFENSEEKDPLVINIWNYKLHRGKYKYI